MQPVLALQFEGVSKAHGTNDSLVRALDCVDLEIGAGELVAVTGRSGAGKSTLLNLAGGLDRPDSGVVMVGGADLSTMSKAESAAIRRRSVGYVFQDYNLLGPLTAVENVALPLELDGVKARAARREAMQALAAVGIADLADRLPREMSGGQQQRVAIARSVVGSRTMILADEPTGALDSATGDQVFGLLRERCAAGVAAVIVTHDPQIAAKADRAIHLVDGRIAEGISVYATAGSDT